MIDKKALRDAILHRRTLVTETQAIRAANCLADHLLPHIPTGLVAAYRSKDGELSVDILCEQLVQRGQKICYPRTLAPGQMEFAYPGESGFKKARFGILEPDGQTVDEDEIAVVLVPGLAYTMTGQRLGFGGGYYDRALTRIIARRIGICFEWQIVPSIPSDPWDCPMDALATDAGYFTGWNNLE